MTNILVTGGAGYVGSHACKALKRAGFTPVVYDNLSVGHRDAVRFGPFERGDISDGARLDAVLSAYRPACVMHFAAYAYAGESVIDPAAYHENNIAGSLSLLAAMRRQDIDRLVFSSSCATYGIPSRLPIDEETPQLPISPYGFSKLATERALQDYGRAYPFGAISLRYFNAAGADPEGELGERHDPEPHVIPSCIRSALTPDTAFDVFGTDYPTPDGSAIRDYVHVTDLASAHVKAVERLLRGRELEAYNLATGQGTSVLEIVRAVERASGHNVAICKKPRREGDPPELYATGEKARRRLGWEPGHSSIETIVETALRWFTRHGVGRVGQSRRGPNSLGTQ